MAGAPLRPLAGALTDVGLRATAYDHRLVMHATRIALRYLVVQGVRDARGPEPIGVYQRVTFGDPVTVMPGETLVLEESTPFIKKET